MSDVIDRFLRTLGKEPDPEYRLATKITMIWLDAVRNSDFAWMKAHIKEMRRLEDLENLERLQKLYDWANANRPKTKL